MLIFDTLTMSVFFYLKRNTMKDFIEISDINGDVFIIFPKNIAYIKAGEKGAKIYFSKDEDPIFLDISIQEFFKRIE